VSASWASGSTRAWRRLRAVVLDRDGHRCQVDVGMGQPCLAPARTVGHVTPRCEGAPLLASTSDLRAECETHNYRAGAQLGNARRRQRAGSQPATWTW
jgi:hypothetical protein